MQLLVMMLQQSDPLPLQLLPLRQQLLHQVQLAQRVIRRESVAHQRLLLVHRLQLLH
jgi:hypothetical protein